MIYDLLAQLPGHVVAHPVAALLGALAGAAVLIGLGRLLTRY